MLAIYSPPFNVHYYINIIATESPEKMIRSSRLGRLCLLFLILLSPGCVNSSKAPPGDEFDAGSVLSGTTPRLVHRFRVTNSTGRTVRLLGEAHSCDCTRVELEKVALKPGASTILSMGLDLSSRYEKRRVSCVVKTDHPTLPEWSYHLKYESFPPARIVPPQIKLGSFRAGKRIAEDLEYEESPEEVWLEVYSTSDAGSLSSPVDQAVPKGIRVVMDKEPLVESLAGGIRRARYRIRADLEDTASAPGNFAQPFVVGLGNGTFSSVMLVWSVMGSLEAIPSQTHFGMVSPGDSPSVRTILLRSVEGKKFALVSFESGAKDLTVETPDLGHSNAAVEHAITLRLTPSSGADRIARSGFVLIRPDLEDAKEIRIPWSVFIRRPETAERDHAVPNLPSDKEHSDAKDGVSCPCGA